MRVRAPARLGFLLALASVALLACDRLPPWAPPPSFPIPPSLDDSTAGGVSEGEPPSPPSDSSGHAPSAPSTPHGPPAATRGVDALDESLDEPEPTISVRFEAPYKLEQRPVPQTFADQRADFLERRRWNDGGLGTLAGEQPKPEGHPDPRIRVNIDEAKGALDVATVQRIARQYHWIHVKRCYQLGAYLDPHLRGWTRGRFTVTRSGKVARAKLGHTELEDRKVARCLIDRLEKLQFPRKPRGTTLKISIKVSPGDDPMPPPKDEIKPGDGELSAEQMLAGVEPAKPAIAACYRAGLQYAPELWGRIPVRFHVTEQGRLDEAFDAGGRFPDPRVKQCILRAARQLRFARPEGGDIRFVVPVRLFTDRSKIPAGEP